MQYQINDNEPVTKWQLLSVFFSTSDIYSFTLTMETNLWRQSYVTIYFAKISKRWWWKIATILFVITSAFLERYLSSSSGFVRLAFAQKCLIVNYVIVDLTSE